MPPPKAASKVKASTSTLNPKQKRFAQEWVQDHNGTQAAIRAGYSARTAQEQSSELLSKPILQQAVAALEVKIAAKSELTAEWVQRRLIAEASAGDLTEPNPARISALRILAEHLRMFPEAARAGAGGGLFDALEPGAVLLLAKFDGSDIAAFLEARRQQQALPLTKVVTLGAGDSALAHPAKTDSAALARDSG